MKPPKLLTRALCTLAAAVLAAAGTLALQTQTHTGNARYQGQVTLFGEAAITMGGLLWCLALLPLVVWLPMHRVKHALVVWWLLLMAVLGWIVWKA